MAITKKITAKGDKRYVVKVRDANGRYFPTKTCKTKVEAAQYERALITKKEANACAVSAKKAKITVDAYVEDWFAGRDGRAGASGWRLDQRRMYRMYVQEHLGSMSLDQVAKPDIGKVLSRAYEAGLSDQSVLHIYNLLSKMFADAVNYFGYLQTSPVSKVDKPKVSKKEREHLTLPETFALLEVARDHPLGTGVWISLWSGLRISEIQALRWKSVDFDKGHVLICEAYKKSIKQIEPHPKQKDWNRVPMPKPLYDFLAMKKEGKFDGMLVAPAVNGSMLDQSNFRRALKIMCRNAGVKEISTHGLRHSCSELWLNAGGSPEDLRRLFGHKNLETTMRYVHGTSDRLTSLASQMSF